MLNADVVCDKEGGIKTSSGIMRVLTWENDHAKCKCIVRAEGADTEERQDNKKRKKGRKRIKTMENRAEPNEDVLERQR